MVRVRSACLWGRAAARLSYMRVTMHLRALSTSEGGRRGPILTGYRPLWDLGDRRRNGDVLWHDGEIVTLSRSELEPGGDADAVVEPFYLDAPLPDMGAIAEAWGTHNWLPQR